MGKIVTFITLCCSLLSSIYSPLPEHARCSIGARRQLCRARQLIRCRPRHSRSVGGLREIGSQLLESYSHRLGSQSY